MGISKRVLAIFASLLAESALAAPPVFHTDTCALTVNGTTIGSALTPGGS